MVKRRKLNVVRKSGKSQAKTQIIDSSNEVNHNRNEECAQFGVDTILRRKRSNAVRKSSKSQAKEKQLIDSSNEVNQNNHSKTTEFAQFEGGMNHLNDVPLSEQQIDVSLPEDTIGRQTRLSVRKRGKTQAKEQLISSDKVNLNNQTINETCCAHCGGGTRENLMVASLNIQNDKSQSKQKIQVGSRAEYPILFGTMGKSVPKDTMGRHTRSNAVRKNGKALAEEELIDSSNAVNQNNRNIKEKFSQLGGVSTRENLMVASLNIQNDRSQSEQVQVGSRVESPIPFDRMNKRLTKDTMGRHTRLNTVRKSRKAQAEGKLIDSSKGVNQNNCNINENCSQLGEDTMERNKRPNTVRKSWKPQAEMQLIDSSIEVNPNNHSINEECDQFVGVDTRGNPMVASPSHQSDQSQSEQQIPVESHVETPNSFGRMSKSLTKGQKKVRGYTRMSEVWDLPDGEFIRVEVDSLGNPIGWEGKKLLNALGCLVRKHQYAPINILSWKNMPELNVTNMLELIQSKFHFVPKLTEQTKQILKDNLSAKWRQFKHDLKEKGYDENMTEEEMAANIPDRRVDPSQYRALVHHWCSPEGQKISNMNKRNRSKYEDVHCMGTKNLPRFIHETTEANGVQPSRAEIYIQTRTRKDGSIVTEKAANVIGELKKHMVEATSSRTPQTTQDSTNWENDVYSKVRGPERRGSVRCLGIRYSKTSSHRANVEKRVHKLENLLGNLVSVLQSRFSADQQINDVLQAIAQEVPNSPRTPNDSFSSDQETSDSNWEN